MANHCENPEEFSIVFEISVSDNQEQQEQGQKDKNIPVNLYEIEKYTLKMADYLFNKGNLPEISPLYSLIKGFKKDINNKSLFIIDVFLCSDAHIWELNLSYRRQDKPTDVLSFALFTDNPDENFNSGEVIHLGEVIISTQTALRQANENGIPFEKELLFLLSHGILHLAGIDHPDEESLNAMLDLQEKMVNFCK